MCLIVIFAMVSNSVVSCSLSLMHCSLCPWNVTGKNTTAKSLQSCPTLCDPRDGSPPGSPVPGILQARTLEWVAISFSNAWKWKEKVKSLSHVRPSATPWTAAYQAPLSMGFSRQEYWSGVPLPSPRILQWVAISYPRGFSRHRDQTCVACVSCTGRWILYFYTTWEAPTCLTMYLLL